MQISSNYSKFARFILKLMVLLKTKKELKSVLDALNKKNSLGLVPTMGALHEGHLSLVKKAIAENESVVVSIFVNPTQFNNSEDLEKYPKTLNADMALLQAISNDLILFVPSVNEIYDQGVQAAPFDFDGLEFMMEGAFRKGHFDGVGTVVYELLTLIKPDRAYFGEKDFQQLTIIKKMVEKKRIPVDIIGCPIVREANGLAMSSRNERLSKRMRNEAAFIYSTLKMAKSKFGTKSAQSVIDWVTNQFKHHKYLKLEYFEITDRKTLTPIRRKQKNKEYQAFIAVYADDVRLIDNIELN